MAVQVSAPELAAALSALDVHKPGMSDQELAECLLVEVIATRLMGGHEHPAIVAAAGRETGQ